MFIPRNIYLFSSLQLNTMTPTTMTYLSPSRSVMDRRVVVDKVKPYTVVDLASMITLTEQEIDDCLKKAAER